MKGSAIRRNPSRGGSTGMVASVATYVLKNGPESLFYWRRLTVKGSRRETNKSVAQAWDDVLKVRGVSRIRPEAERSMRGQVEA